MSVSISSLQAFFSNYSNLNKFYVAFSGGLVSTVLLHMMHQAQLPIHAVYVNHHLQKESDNWEKHCKKNCKAWGIAFSAKHANIAKVAQKSIEDSAREARYTLLKSMLDDTSAIVTAHHKDDLAETVLLQLLRGAGPAGLAAMPKCKKLSKGFHLRPLLEGTRKELSEYAKIHNLKWVEDPSNVSYEHDRNYLRKEVMPRLLERWPSANQTLARSAGLQAEAKVCLDELAKIDIRDTETSQSDVLKIPQLQKLSSERLNNVLRYWIRFHQIRVPSKKVLQHVVLDLVLKEDIESSPVQTWKEGEIRRYQNRLYLMSPLPSHDPTQVLRWKIDQPLFIKSLNRTLRLEDLKKQGVDIPENANELTVRFREGGERLKPHGQKQRRTLKNLLNEAEIPPWERARIPLLFHNDQLISVLGYWNAKTNCETSLNL